MAEESKFKWNNRKKATETAVKFKVEDSLSPEEAVKKVMGEYEGVYFVNGKDITEKRFNNFVARVESEKKYKASNNTPTEVTLSQSKIKLLIDKGELTELQALVLDSVYNQLASYLFGTSDVTLADVSEDSGIKVDRVKGVLGHLIKKGFLHTEEKEIGGEKLNVILINDDKRELFNDDLLKYLADLDEEQVKVENEPNDEDDISDEELKKVMSELNNAEKEEATN
jgi:predicted transcriptional regulator